jgi:hypothetical protein
MLSSLARSSLRLSQVGGSRSFSSSKASLAKKHTLVLVRYGVLHPACSRCSMTAATSRMHRFRRVQ